MTRFISYDGKFYNLKELKYFYHYLSNPFKKEKDEEKYTIIFCFNEYPIMFEVKKKDQKKITENFKKFMEDKDCNVFNINDFFD